MTHMTIKYYKEMQQQSHRDCITILLSDQKSRVSLVATQKYYHDLSYNYMSTTCICVTQ